MGNDIAIDNDLIQRLVSMDVNFMNKLGKVKDKIVDNLDAYAGTLASVGIGDSSDTKSTNNDATPRSPKDKTQGPENESMVDKFILPKMNGLIEKLGAMGDKPDMASMGSSEERNDDDGDSNTGILDTIKNGFTDSLKSFIHKSVGGGDEDEDGGGKGTGMLSTINEKIGNIANGSTEEGVFEDDDTKKVVIVGYEGKAAERMKSIAEGIKITKGGGVELGDGGKSKTGKFLKGIGGKLVKSLGLTTPSWISTAASAAGAAAPVIMLVGGIVWAAIDGIRGFMSADKWGVSKVSGAMGGLLGGMDKGLKGAVKNMGKWALVGAGIGTAVVPVVGTILGGLIGGVIGAILGWIGGERIAKAFDAIGRWFTAKWNALTDFIADKMLIIYEYWRDLFVSIGNWFKEKWAWLKAKINDVMLLIGDTLILMIDQITLPYKLLWKYMKIAGKWLADKFNALTDFIGDMMLNIYETWKDRFARLWEGIKAVGRWLGDKFAQFKEYLTAKIMSVYNQLKGVFFKFIDGLTFIGQWLSDKFVELKDNVFAGIGFAWEWLKGLGDKIGDIFGNVKVWFAEKWEGITNGVSAVFTNLGEWFSGLKTKIKDKIVAIKEKLLGVLDKFNPLKWFKNDDNEVEDASNQKAEDLAKSKKGWKWWGKKKDDEAEDEEEWNKQAAAIQREAEAAALASKTRGGPNVETPTPSTDVDTTKKMDESNKAVEDALSRVADILAENGARNEQLLSEVISKPVAVTPPAPLNTGGMRESAGDAAYAQRKNYQMSNGGM